MTQARNVRAEESREENRAAEARPETAWKPTSLLDAPEARPGMGQRKLQTTCTNVCVKAGTLALQTQ